MIKSIFRNIAVCTCLAALTSPLSVLAGQPDEKQQDVVPLSLERATSIALEHNPGLAQITARAHALAEVPTQVGTLPDPVLSLKALNLPNDTYSVSQEAMTQRQIGIIISLPFPGKLDLREQTAHLEAKAAVFDVDEARLLLLKNVRIVWWNLFYLHRSMPIVQHNQELLRQFVKIAETKYKTGQGMQSDVLLAQVELSKLLDIEISLQASLYTQQASLNALLNQPASTPVVLPEQKDESLPAAPAAERLHQLALQSRPALAAKRLTQQAAHTRVALAKKNYYPDFKLGAAYGLRSGNNPNGSARADFTSLTLSMSLPFFTSKKQDSALAQRKAEVLQQQYGLQDSIAQVDAEIEQALADYLAAKERTSLFKTGIIPQASQTTAAMLAAYQVNKVDVLNLLRSQITLFDYETQYWKALSSGWQAWARLEAAIGTSIQQAGQLDAAVNTDKD